MRPTHQFIIDGNVLAYIEQIVIVCKSMPQCEHYHDRGFKYLRLNHSEQVPNDLWFAVLMKVHFIPL